MYLRLLTALVVSLSLLFLTVLLATAETGSVTVKQAAVNKSPRVFSKTIETLHYSDRVEVLVRDKGWVQIELADGRSGWIRSSHLSKPELALQAGEQMVAVAASDAELTLAGKGFDSQVEKQYRQQHADVDYAWINRMESYHHDSAELTSFLKQGGLSLSQGGDHAN